MSSIEKAEHVSLSADEARTLTDQVKTRAAELWADLLRLYEGDAHRALGYSSWADYYAAEFGGSKSSAYRLLDAARVDRLIESRSPNGERPATEAVARELVPVLREDPEAVAETWQEAVTEHGPAPTAAEVRTTVQERTTADDDRKAVETIDAEPVAAAHSTAGLPDFGDPDFMAKLADAVGVPEDDLRAAMDEEDDEERAWSEIEAAMGRAKRFADQALRTVVKHRGVLTDEHLDLLAEDVQTLTETLDEARALANGLPGYALDLVSAMRHVITRLANSDEWIAFDTFLDYRAMPGDLSRVRHHEGCDSDYGATKWIIERAISKLGPAVMVRPDGSGYKLSGSADEVYVDGQQILVYREATEEERRRTAHLYEDDDMSA